MLEIDETVKKMLADRFLFGGGFSDFRSRGFDQARKIANLSSLIKKCAAQKEPNPAENQI